MFGFFSKRPKEATWHELWDTFTLILQEFRSAQISIPDHEKFFQIFSGIVKKNRLTISTAHFEDLFHAYTVYAMNPDDFNIHLDAMQEFMNKDNYPGYISERAKLGKKLAKNAVVMAIKSYPNESKNPYKNQLDERYRSHINTMLQSRSLIILIGDDRVRKLAGQIIVWALESGSRIEHKICAVIKLRLDKLSESNIQPYTVNFSNLVIELFAEVAIHDFGMDPLEELPSDFNESEKWLKKNWEINVTTLKNLQYAPDNLTAMDILILMLMTEGSYRRGHLKKKITS